MPKRLTSSNTQDLGQFYVRNSQGQNVPLSALASFRNPFLARNSPCVYNLSTGRPRSSAAPRPVIALEQATAALEVMFFKQTMPHA